MIETAAQATRKNPAVLDQMHAATRARRAQHTGANEKAASLRIKRDRLLPIGRLNDHARWLGADHGGQSVRPSQRRHNARDQRTIARKRERVDASMILDQPMIRPLLATSAAPEFFGAHGTHGITFVKVTRVARCFHHSLALAILWFQPDQ
ncbi:hypothetical protein [Bradyrhizobium sp. Ai1a-2]|uniref:hypothetical protein n=1 Tax=Bradyrhizobium sp. Ai1a-2 TaxID=196490 RepID=UPI0012679458|nr:hypothetical protein [Bradyrhizobium sp. Ai1a-2]